MADDRARRQIAFIAAQLMYQRTESEYFTAQRKAARQLGMGDRFRPGGLPSNAEIRDQIRSFARLYDRRPGCLEWRPRAGYDGPDEFE